MRKTSWYEKFSKIAAKASGRSGTFAAACVVVGLWLMSSPVFDYSDTWQLVINTATTIITFLMVFLIQHTQNRDAEAVQIKLDELIRATKGAHNALLDLEGGLPSSSKIISETSTRHLLLKRKKVCCWKNRIQIAQG